MTEVTDIEKARKPRDVRVRVLVRFREDGITRYPDDNPLVPRAVAQQWVDKGKAVIA